MSEGKDKTPEQVSDEDYKVAPTSADEKYLGKKLGPPAKTTSLQKKRRRNSKGPRGVITSSGLEITLNDAI